jgi:hypothetical protein
LANFQPSLNSKVSRPSARGFEKDEPDPLPRNRLGCPIDVIVSKDSDDWISARHWMIGKKDDRLTASRNLDRTPDHTLAGQLLAQPRRVPL